MKKSRKFILFPLISDRHLSPLASEPIGIWGHWHLSPLASEGIGIRANWHLGPSSSESIGIWVHWHLSPLASEPIGIWAHRHLSPSASEFIFMVKMLVELSALPILQLLQAAKGWQRPIPLHTFTSQKEAYHRDTMPYSSKTTGKGFYIFPVAQTGLHITTMTPHRPRRWAVSGSRKANIVKSVLPSIRIYSCSSNFGLVAVLGWNVPGFMKRIKLDLVNWGRSLWSLHPFVPISHTKTPWYLLPN